MVCLGNSILGNLNKQATSQESLGLPFWRLVIASGIIVLVMGSINILAVRRPEMLMKSGSSNVCFRAMCSAMPGLILQLDKSDPMVRWRLTKPTWKPPRQSHPVDAVAIAHSFWAANATRYLRIILANLPSAATWPKPPRCTLLFRALSPNISLSAKPHRVPEPPARNTARAPDPSDTLQALSSTDRISHITQLSHTDRLFRKESIPSIGQYWTGEDLEEMIAR